MNKLFIHQPIFRLLSPVFIGVMVYMLILLLNNDTSQVYLLFESQEVYVCIIAAYFILELNRMAIVISKKIKIGLSEWQQSMAVGVINCLIAVLFASITLHFYFSIWVGFSPSQAELLAFNSIYVVVSLLYFTLYFSHTLLSSENTLRLDKEQLVKESISNEFADFRNDINPNLLYGSLERIITLAHENPDQAEELIDYLSSVYRYMLGHKQTELVPLFEETEAVHQLVNLLNALPDFNVKLDIEIEDSSTHVIPGTITSLVEDIAKRTISNHKTPLVIQFYREEEYLVVQYKTNDRLSLLEENVSLEKSQRAYSYYIDAPIVEVNAYDDCYTKIPILTLEQNVAM